MLEALQKILEAGRGSAPPQKAEAVARALMEEGQARREQATRVAGEVTELIRRSAERLLDAFRAEVRSQISKAGLATKDEVEALKRRIRKLESASRPQARRASSSASRRKGSSAKA